MKNSFIAMLLSAISIAIQIRLNFLFNMYTLLKENKKKHIIKNKY
jgi:hypothetical protein